MDICFIEGNSVFRHAAEDAIGVFRDEADELELVAIEWLAREIRERALNEPGTPSILDATDKDVMRVALHPPRRGERPVLFLPTGKLDLEMEMVGKWVTGAGKEDAAFHRRLQAMTFDAALEQAVAWELTAATHAP